jgi:ArsR family transcriptional regulator, nickel/cobalt-responsive transcriptional repressor
MPEASNADESLRYLRALGDPDRLKIVQILQAGPKSVGELCDALGSPIANVSHHLGLLKETGIVSASKRGRFVIYQLKHVVAAGQKGTQILDYGCCRIEFGEGREPRPLETGRPEEQALLILNRMVDRARGGSAADKKRKRKPAKSDVRPGDGDGLHRVHIINSSFEKPATPFFDTAVEGWQKEGPPAGTGVFRNFPDDVPIPGSRFIVNADGDQLAAIGARHAGGAGKACGLFQSIAGSGYERGATYVLTVDVGVSSVQPPTSDGGTPPLLRVSLTCTYANGRRQEVAGRSVTPADLDTAGNRLTSVSVTCRIGPAERNFAGREIGILISTAQNSARHQGNFIIDSVTLAIERRGDDNAPARARRSAPKPRPRRGS